MSDPENIIQHCMTSVTFEYKREFGHYFLSVVNKIKLGSEGGIKNKN